jgi:probable HAF family extracellular repeat protein
MHSPLPHTIRVARIPTLAPQSLPDASAAAPITTPRFEVIDLDRTPDAAVRALAAALRRAPRDLNGRGQRAATLLREGVEHAVLRERDHVVELGVLQPGDESSRALALNDAGQVVGLSRRGLHEHAFLWQAGRLWPLGDLRDPCVDRSRPVTPLAVQPRPRHQRPRPGGRPRRHRRPRLRLPVVVLGRSAGPRRAAAAGVRRGALARGRRAAHRRPGSHPRHCRLRRPLPRRAAAAFATGAGIAAPHLRRVVLTLRPSRWRTACPSSPTSKPHRCPPH